MDYGNTCITGLSRFSKHDLVAIDQNLTLICYIYACEHLHQRGLARAVFTADHMDLARTATKAHVIQDGYAAKAFTDISHLQPWRACGL